MKTGKFLLSGAISLAVAGLAFAAIPQMTPALAPASPASEADNIAAYQLEARPEAPGAGNDTTAYVVLCNKSDHNHTTFLGKDLNGVSGLNNAALITLNQSINDHSRYFMSIDEQSIDTVNTTDHANDSEFYDLVLGSKNHKTDWQIVDDKGDLHYIIKTAVKTNGHTIKWYKSDEYGKICALYQTPGVELYAGFISEDQVKFHEAAESAAAVYDAVSADDYQGYWYDELKKAIEAKPAKYMTAAEWQAYTAAVKKAVKNYQAAAACISFKHDSAIYTAAMPDNQSLHKFVAVLPTGDSYSMIIGGKNKADFTNTSHTAVVSENAIEGTDVKTLTVTDVYEAKLYKNTVAKAPFTYATLTVHFNGIAKDGVTVFRGYYPQTKNITEVPETLNIQTENGLPVTKTFVYESYAGDETYYNQLKKNLYELNNEDAYAGGHFSITAKNVSHTQDVVRTEVSITYTPSITDVQSEDTCLAQWGILSYKFGNKNVECKLYPTKALNTPKPAKLVVMGHNVYTHNISAAQGALSFHSINGQPATKTVDVVAENYTIEMANNDAFLTSKVVSETDPKEAEKFTSTVTNKKVVVNEAGTAATVYATVEVTYTPSDYTPIDNNESAELQVAAMNAFVADPAGGHAVYDPADIAHIDLNASKYTVNLSDESLDFPWYGGTKNITVSYESVNGAESHASFNNILVATKGQLVDAYCTDTDPSDYDHIHFNMSGKGTKDITVTAAAFDEYGVYNDTVKFVCEDGDVVCELPITITRPEVTLSSVRYKDLSTVKLTEDCKNYNYAVPFALNTAKDSVLVSVNIANVKNAYNNADVHFTTESDNYVIGDPVYVGKSTYDFWVYINIEHARPNWEYDDMLTVSIYKAGDPINMREKVEIPLHGEPYTAAELAKYQNATGINTVVVDNETSNGVMFNIAGQRVNNSAKGIIIKNGKKVVVK